MTLTPGSADDSLLRRRYGERGLQMAQAVGLTPLLVQTTRLEQQQRPDQPVSSEYLLLRQKISDQLQLASFDISTAAALLDCDSKRATLTATLLTRRENVREKRMTISAITIGAVAIIGASLLNLASTTRPPTCFILPVGWAREGWACWPCGRNHPPPGTITRATPSARSGPGPARQPFFPPLVWYFLNQAKTGRGPALVESLRSHWELLTSLDAGAKKNRKHAHREVDYFGDGDTYTAEELTIRASMLGQLETEIRLMNNDLTILLNEIVLPARRR